MTSTDTGDGGPEWTEGVHFHFRGKENGSPGFVIDQCMDRGDGLFEVGASYHLDLATAISYAADMTALLGISLRLHGGELPAEVWRTGYTAGARDQESHQGHRYVETHNPYTKAI